MGRPRVLVHGFGVNDADYTVQPTINGKREVCAIYSAWKNMIARCYSKNHQQQCKTYIGVTVCDEWKSFMAFRKWWIENHVDGWHLDKDLLTDNRQYSPKNCIYIPRWLNNFTIDHGLARGEWPIGVHMERVSGLFVATCNSPETLKRVTIGRFKTPIEAHLAWKAKKLEHAAQMKVMMDSIDSRIYHRVLDTINRAK